MKHLQQIRQWIKAKQQNPPYYCSSTTRGAWTIFLSQFLLFVIIQLTLYAVAVLQLQIQTNSTTNRGEAFCSFLLWLPFMQLQNLVAGVVLVLCYYFLPHRIRWLYFALLVLLDTYLFVNFFLYKTLEGPISWFTLLKVLFKVGWVVNPDEDPDAAAEAGGGGGGGGAREGLQSSAMKKIDLSHFFILALIIVVLVINYRVLFRLGTQPSSKKSPRERKEKDESDIEEGNKPRSSPKSDPRHHHAATNRKYVGWVMLFVYVMANVQAWPYFSPYTPRLQYHPAVYVCNDAFAWLLVRVGLVSPGEDRWLANEASGKWFNSFHNKYLGNTTVIDANLVDEFTRSSYGKQDRPRSKQDDIEEALAKNFANRVKERTIKNGNKLPNIVWVVWESTGSWTVNNPVPNNTVPHSLPLQEVLPRVNRLTRNHDSIVFTDVYNTMGSSIRILMQLFYGGIIPTVSWSAHVRSSVSEAVGGWKGQDLVEKLKSKGYKTGFFGTGRYDWDAIDIFWRGMKWDQYWSYGHEKDKSWQTKNYLNGWGGTEEGTLEKTGKWLDSIKDGDDPMFLSMFTVSAHHPYDVTPAFEKIIKENPDMYNIAATKKDPAGAGMQLYTDYRKSIWYSDWMFGELMSMLKARGMLDNTIVAVMGDHGEAFGTYHAGDTDHGQLWETNVKTWLTVVDCRSKITEQEAATTHNAITKRQVFVHDLAPSMLSLLGMKNDWTSGSDLFDPKEEDRVRTGYFFTLWKTPDKIGLIDGKYKFISMQWVDPQVWTVFSGYDHRSGDSDEQYLYKEKLLQLQWQHNQIHLYDLEKDPFEANDIAPQRLDQVRDYYYKAMLWSVYMNCFYEGRKMGLSTPAIMCKCEPHSLYLPNQIPRNCKNVH